jgi:hypothetical protein
VNNECHTYDMLAQTRALVPLRAGGGAVVFENVFGRSSTADNLIHELRPQLSVGGRQSAIGSDLIWPSNAERNLSLSQHQYTFSITAARAITVSQAADLDFIVIDYSTGCLVSLGLFATTHPSAAANYPTPSGPYAVGTITISTGSLNIPSPDPSPSSRIEDIKQQCLAIVTRFDNSLTRKVSNSIRLQLIKLFNPQDWDESDSLPTSASFNSAVAFLAVNNELRVPSITIAQNNFVFSFLKNRDRRNAVHLEFEADGWVTFIVSLAPVGHYPKAPRAAMKVPFDEVRPHLELMTVWDWLAT